MDFLEIVEVLLDGRPVGELFQNLDHRRLGSGAKETLPAVVRSAQHPSEDAGGQEHLVRSGDRLAVQQQHSRLPTVGLAGTPRLGQAAQGRIAAPPAHHHAAVGQGALQERPGGIGAVAFDQRAIALGGRVVPAEEQTLLGHDDRTAL